MDEKVDNITEDELVVALFSAQAASTGVAAAGALTTRTLTEMVNRHRAWVRERLRSLLAEGLVECVKIQMTDIAGRVTTVPAYRLKVKKEGEIIN